MWMVLGQWRRRVGDLVRLLMGGELRVMGVGEEGWGGKDLVGCGDAGR